MHIHAYIHVSTIPYIHTYIIQSNICLQHYTYIQCHNTVRTCMHMYMRIQYCVYICTHIRMYTNYIHETNTTTNQSIPTSLSDYRCSMATSQPQGRNGHSRNNQQFPVSCFVIQEPHFKVLYTVGLGWGK